MNTSRRHFKSNFLNDHRLQNEIDSIYISCTLTKESIPSRDFPFTTTDL